MDKHARNEYMKKLKERYCEANKKGKGKILDEYCRNTEQNRKYVIRKFWMGTGINQRRTKRKGFYGSEVISALAKCWAIFDSPCGQRLAPLLKDEVERLRVFGELRISNGVADKLKRISPKTIDRKLKHHKETVGYKRKYQAKKHPLLYHKIPVRGNDWDTSLVGQVEIDLVEHCGASAAGEFINSLSVTDIASGWWEGQAIMGRSQQRSFAAIDKVRHRTPFLWQEIHPDNDTTFINWQLLRYAQQENIRFSRSRPYHKKDNCFIEQKNSTHIRQVLGYLRHDTPWELAAINDLYENELRLYKNFFQPVMKLKEKTRDKGKIHRKYDLPKTPFRRLMESGQINQETKRKLKTIYAGLNPAALKRTIDQKLNKLYELYQQKKKRTQNIMIYKKLRPRTRSISVTYYLTQSKAVGLPT
jgi:hypothetical protein